jgi:hypothetical protein
MAGNQKPQAGQLFRVREGFAVPGPDGFLRTYPTGALVDGGDPIAASHGHLMEPAANKVEQATAAPGERRVLGIRLPQRQTVEQVTAHHAGQAHEVGPAHVRVPTNLSTTELRVEDGAPVADETETETDETPTAIREGGPDVVHALPPEHPDSPASVHAPLQPGLGVVADDADERGQNSAGGPKSSEAEAAVKKAAAQKVTAAGEASGERGIAVAQGGDASGGTTETIEPDKQGATKQQSGRSSGSRSNRKSGGS